MAVYKLFEEIEETEFQLIAIHTSLEDYRLAFEMNKRLHTGFVQLSEGILVSQNSSFQLFEWIDECYDTVWNLIANKIEIEKPNTTNTFFFSEMTAKEIKYLIPEKKKVDFFLKISNDESYLDTMSILKHIQQIPNILTAYTVKANQLKSKSNLIF